MDRNWRLCLMYQEQLAVAAAAIKHDVSSLTAQQLAITAWAFGRLERNDSQVAPASKTS